MATRKGSTAQADIMASVEARLAKFLAASPAVIYSYQAKGDHALTYVSENLTRLLGYHPEEFVADAKFWRSLVHREDLPRIKEEIAAFMQCGESVLEYRLRKKDGHYAWIRDERHLVRDEAGAPVEVLGSWLEITSRKHSEQAEAALKARLGLLLESAPSVIYSFRASGDFAPTFVSENLKRLLGYCPADYMRNADFWRSRVHPADLKSVEAEQVKVFEEGRHTSEYRFRKEDGTYGWVADEQHLVRNAAGEPSEIVGSWSDITKRRKAEQTENATQARFALMLQSAPSVIYSFKATGSFKPTFISDNIVRVFGYEATDYLKQADFWRSRVHPEDLEMVEASAAELFETGRHTVEYRFRKADGNYAWVNDEQQLLLDHYGQPLEVVGSWSEVTERKTAEQAALARSEQLLVDAIESISEAFSLFDEHDRLIMANRKFAEFFDVSDNPPQPGTLYEDLLRDALLRGVIGQANLDPEVWLEKRLARHHEAGEPLVSHLPDGRWLRISERRTASGGTVAIYSDITEIKDNEQRAAAANQLIMQSLRYASRIQAAILPAARELASVAEDHFLIWEPRDIVGGDFFWFQRVRDGYAIIVGDCTGHGVPGAFMTLVAWGLLDRMLHNAENGSPSEVLSGLHRGVQSLLGQDIAAGETDDGLEAGVCFINPKERTMTFAGARFSLWRANGGNVIEIKGNRQGLGYRRFPQGTIFTDNHLDLHEDDRFYLTTDGLIDQIGGPRSRSFGKGRFQQLLKHNHGQPMPEQAEHLRRTLADYQGQEIRRDDLTVLGFAPLLQ